MSVNTRIRRNTCFQLRILIIVFWQQPYFHNRISAEGHGPMFLSAGSQLIKAWGQSERYVKFVLLLIPNFTFQGFLEHFKLAIVPLANLKCSPKKPACCIGRARKGMFYYLHRNKEGEAVENFCVGLWYKEYFDLGHHFQGHSKHRQISKNSIVGFHETFFAFRTVLHMQIDVVLEIFEKNPT